MNFGNYGRTPSEIAAAEAAAKKLATSPLPPVGGLRASRERRERGTTK